MPPAPTRPRRTGSVTAAMSGGSEGPDRLGGAGGQVVDVLVGEALVPGQDQGLLEPGEGPGEAFGRVVDGLGPGQRPRPAAGAESDLVGNDLASEGRLLDVPGRGRDVVELERLGHRARAARNQLGVDS